MDNQIQGNQAQARDWRKAMSDHVAYALLVYTALQIFVTIHAMKGESHSILPYFALIVLVAGIIPACRRFEGRWIHLADDQAHDPSMGPAFRRDLIRLWALAIGLPFALTGLFLAITAIV